MSESNDDDGRRLLASRESRDTTSDEPAAPSRCRSVFIAFVALSGAVAFALLSGAAMLAVVSMQRMPRHVLMPPPPPPPPMSPGASSRGSPSATLLICATEPAPVRVYARHVIARCDIKRTVPVRPGARAERSCNLACSAASDCRAYVVSIDARRVRCALKSCDGPRTTAAPGKDVNTSVLTRPPRECQPGDVLTSYNTISGAMRQIGTV